MPKEIQAVKCESCGKLIDSTGRYLILEVVGVKEKVPDNSTSYEKDKAKVLSKTDCVCCDSECFSRLILEALE